MVKIANKLSTWVMTALFIIALVVLGLFYFVGYDNPVGEYNDPQNTELLICTVYAFLGVAIVATLAGVIAQFCGSLKDNPKSAIQSVLGIILLVAVIVVCYAMSSDAPVLTGDGLYTDAQWLKITDTLIYSVYILMAIAVLGVFVSAIGILKPRQNYK